VEDDLPITLLEPTKEGHTFVAWHDSDELDSPVTEIEDAANITLFAEFEENVVEPEEEE
jgi:uncharacterized repeat protein (TIGR02543 family)